MTPNQQRFADLYRKNLHLAVKERPDEYRHIVGNVDNVADKMIEAVKRGTYNKDGFAFRRTCKELGLKHTYAAINSYWKGLDNVQADQAAAAGSQEPV